MSINSHKKWQGLPIKEPFKTLNELPGSRMESPVTSLQLLSIIQFLKTILSIYIDMMFFLSIIIHYYYS